MNRIKELEERLKAIETELDSADETRTAELEKEVTGLIEERDKLKTELEKRQSIRSKVAAGLAGTVINSAKANEEDAKEAKAKEFAETRRMAIDTTEVRAALISSGTLATPTQVSGINDAIGTPCSLIDLVKVENCEGMSTNRVAYVDEDAAAAAVQTEGSAATSKEAAFNFVDITPTSVAVYSQISEQAKKQTPLQYESKVTEQALKSLRKKATAIAANKLKASTLNKTVTAAVGSGKGVIDEKTLRNIVLQYGGDEDVAGNAVLILNKNDLVAFGDVRGEKEKKAVYEITPDTANPNMGMIKDGGLSVRYCLCNEITPCAGTAQATAAVVTMIYGNPQCLELDLFSAYRIKVSEDFAFTSLMDTIRGDVELGSDVVVKNGFIAYTIPASE